MMKRRPLQKVRAKKQFKKPFIDLFSFIQLVKPGYTTPLDVDNCEIDEYIIFKQVLEEVQGTNPAWYNVLTGTLTADQQKALTDVIVLADQRRAAAESKRIEEAGGTVHFFQYKPKQYQQINFVSCYTGYSFNQQTVPNSFNFGGNGSTSPFSR